MKKVLTALILLPWLYCFAQKPLKVITEYHPELGMTAVMLVSLMPKADRLPHGVLTADKNHAVDAINIGILYVCPGRKTACGGNDEAGLKLMVFSGTSQNDDWVFKSQQPVRLRFQADGSQITIPKSLDWEPGEDVTHEDGSFLFRSELLTAKIPNSILIRLAAATKVSGRLGDVTFHLTPSELQQLKTFVSRMR